MRNFSRGIGATVALILVMGLQACGGGGSGSSPGTPVLGTAVESAVLTLSASSTAVSSASPAEIKAILKDASGNPVPGQVVTFKVVRSLAVTNVSTALTNAKGEASALLAPASAAGAGADELVASVSYGGQSLQQTLAFQVNASTITLAFDALPAGFTLSDYGQLTLVLNVAGASAISPVAVSVSSACVAQGKATLSPATTTTSSSSLALQYRDNGCGALQASDAIQAVVAGASSTATLALPLARPGVASLAFIQAFPESIFLKGSGLAESSLVTFEVRDVAGNALPNQDVSLVLLTGAGGVLMEGRQVGTAVSYRSDASGRVSVRVNSGTVPTPVRVQATVSVLVSGVATSVSTVSSNLSVGVGLPAQINFSMSQAARNIEGYNIDGMPNTYAIIASDRTGNAVPAGTSINFSAEGGQIEAAKQIQLVAGISRASVNYVSSQPRPADGRVTITAYALGEESFIDLNGNNSYDFGEPFQDLGNVFKDRRFNGAFDSTEDEFVSLNINAVSACAAPGSALLALDPSIPSAPATCDGVWSGAGKVYVRRAVETVLSTSGGRPLWYETGGASGGRGLSEACQKLTLQVAPAPTATASYTAVAGQTWYSGSGANGTLTLIVADANNNRLNPMAAGTTIAASTTTTGLTVTLDGGSPVPSTSEASLASLSYSFGATAPTSGLITVTFTSPSGITSSVAIPVVNGNRPSICPP
jgi:hypothetical protein